ncbi:MAG: DUF1540 domain-containing protein [Limnochordales bacterium]|nr:DUF1540 domain-containing protein [Limnochordales bacterium]
MPQVKCTVSNCFFWEKDFCNASEIEVAVNRSSTLPGRMPREEVGEVGAIERYAQDTTDTCCVTFRPAGKVGATYEEAGRYDQEKG